MKVEYILVDRNKLENLEAKLDGLIELSQCKNDESMDAVEAAQFLHIHIGTLYRLTREKMIPCLTVGRRYIYMRHQLQEYLNNQADE